MYVFKTHIDPLSASAVSGVTSKDRRSKSHRSMPSCYGDPSSSPASVCVGQCPTGGIPTAQRFPSHKMLAGDGCPGRNIYIDLGANWCNTLDAFQHVPNVSALSHPGKPWHIYAFEASPFIAPYVEKCCAAMSKGLPLPPPPVPPTASSGQLLAYAEQLGCGQAGGKQRVLCMSKQLADALLSLEPQPWLSSNATLLSARLKAARVRGCASRGRAPSPAGGEARGGPAAGGTPEQMRGGAFRVLTNASRVRGRGGSTFDVAQVDVVRWLMRSFTRDDFVVLKMDVEGAEAQLSFAARGGGRAARRRVDVGMPPEVAGRARPLQVHGLGGGPGAAAWRPFTATRIGSSRREWVAVAEAAEWTAKTAAGA